MHHFMCKDAAEVAIEAIEQYVGPSGANGRAPWVQPAERTRGPAPKTTDHHRHRTAAARLVQHAERLSNPRVIVATVEERLAF